MAYANQYRKYDFQREKPAEQPTPEKKKRFDDLVHVRYTHKVVTYKQKTYLVTERTESVWKPMAYLEKVLNNDGNERE